MSNNPLNGATYVFKNLQYGTVMDLSAFGSADQTPIIGFHYKDPKVDNMTNQQWTLVQSPLSTTWPLWKLQSVATKTFVDLYLGGSNDGTPIYGWHGGDSSQQGNPHQLWRIVSADPSGQLVKIQNYGTNTFVDLSSGTDVTQIVGNSGQPFDEKKSQIWIMQKVTQ